MPELRSGTHVTQLCCEVEWHARGNECLLTGRGREMPLHFGVLTATQTAVLGAILIGLVVGALGTDYCIAWFARTVIDVSLGFPKTFRIHLPAEGRSKIHWVRLGTCRCGGTVTNRLFSAVLDDGVAFDLRSTFGRSMMQTVVVPWQRLRLEAAQGAVTEERVVKLQVVSDRGDVTSTIEPGDSDANWLAEVAERIQQIEPARS